MIRNGRAYTLKTENGLGDECAQITDGATMGCIDTAGFMSLVFGWIHDHISPANRTYTKSSSYGFKHMVENYTGHYITNNQFKDAMLLCGYHPVKADETNWLFKIKFPKMNEGLDKLQDILTPNQNEELRQWVKAQWPDVECELIDEERHKYLFYPYVRVEWFKAANSNEIIVGRDENHLRLKLKERP